VFTNSGGKVKKINLDLRNFKRKNFEDIKNRGTFVGELKKQSIDDYFLCINIQFIKSKIYLQKLY
jgi:hypothetical protein